MKKATTEDRLRQEYFDLLPELIKIQKLIEAKIKWYLKDTIYNLYKKHQQIEIESRVKDCDSAIETLRRRQKQTHRFDENKSDSYTLTALTDLVGLRILVFPPSLIQPVSKVITSKFNAWKPDHTKIDKKVGKKNKKITICKKYRGIVNRKLDIKCEIQIISMLIGAFWDIEHFVLYKPDPTYKGIKEDLTMRRLNNDVLIKLDEFEATFERLISYGSNNKKT